jgi:copper(I)-binding protein
VTRATVLVMAAAAAVALAGCADQAEPTELAASGAWARPTPTGATNGVVYLSLTTDVPDQLVQAAVPVEVAATAELHATVGDDGGHSGGGHHGGGGGETMTMVETEAVDVVPGEVLEFAPGGNHVMLVDLAAPLARGGGFELELRFASGRTLVVDVVVADNPPA